MTKLSKSTSKLLLLILLGTLCASSVSTETLSSTAITWFSCFSPIQDTNWTYSKGFSTITCAGNTYVGPYGKDAKITSPTFSVGPHHGIIVSFQLGLMDSWDSETFKVTADDVQVYARTHNHKDSTNPNTCLKSKYSDTYERVTFGFNHFASTLTLVFSSNLNDGTDDESWGICNLVITATPYPVDSAGNSLTKTATSNTTTFFACSSPPNEAGWTYTAGYSKITCGGNTYLGPYAKGAKLISPGILLGTHQGINVAFKMAWIDSWDSETFTIIANGVEVYSKTYSGASSPSNTCHKKWADAYETITFGFNHTESYVVFVFSSTLNDNTDDESWGICNFAVTSTAYPVTSSGSPISTPGSPPFSSSPETTLSSVFPNLLNFGCLNLNTIKNTLTSALSHFSGANSVTKAIIDTTVNSIVTALQSNDYTGDVASSNACLGNFDGSYITEEIDECSAMLLPESSRYSVLSFNVPVPGGVCSAEPGITMASFCVAMGSYNGLPSLSIQANAGALSCLATAGGSGVGYAIGTALDAGLDTVSLGVSLTASFVKSTTLFTGNVEEVEISGNYYDYISLEIDPEMFGLPEVFEISGSATRVIKVMDNAATWVNKLSTANNAQDVALQLFGNLSMLVALETEITLALAGQTQGLLPDLGPYQLGLGTLYATTYPATLASGQNLKAGVYIYVRANNILPALISDIVSPVLNKVSGILNLILKEFGLSVSNIIGRLTPFGKSEKNEFGFMVNTQEISLLVQTTVGALTTVIPSSSTISLQCTFKYNGPKFSCKLNLGSISKLFTGFINGAIWVIKEAQELFDETGRVIAFVDKQLAAFTDDAVKTTATNIKNGLIVVGGYTVEAMAWASKVTCGFELVQDGTKCGTASVAEAVYCGSDYITDMEKCGTRTVTSSVECGMKYVTSGAECGWETVTDAIKCGTDSITSGAVCGWDTVANCFASGFQNCKTAKSCKVPKSCKIEKSCNVPATCNVAASCHWPRTCTIDKTCAIDNVC